MPEFDPQTRDLLSAMLLMAVLLVAVALGIQVIAVYRRRLTTRANDVEAELAESFREAYEEGELSTDEYRQIRETLERGLPLPPPRTPAGDPGVSSIDPKPEQETEHSGEPTSETLPESDRGRQTDPGDSPRPD